MKSKLFLLSSILFCQILLGQKLSLDDLESITNKTNWESVNHYLMKKGWEYYESEKGNSLKYNTITWSYNKEYNSDEAQAWFYLFTYDGFPNKINYSVFNKPAYTTIRNSLNSKGYKLSDSEIKNNELVSTYSRSWIPICGWCGFGGRRTFGFIQPAERKERKPAGNISYSKCGLKC